MKKVLGRPNTIRTYQSIYSNWIENKETNKIVEDLHDLTTPVGYRTRMVILRLLRKERPEEFLESMGNTLLTWLQRNVNNDTIKALNKYEASKIMQICKKKHSPFYPILLLALHGGLRRGEIFGLKWGQIDFLNNSIFIKHSYDGPTKSGKPRKIPMSRELEKSLMERYTLVEGENQKLFSNVNPNPILEAICKEAGVRRVTFHQLRHTFATLALESGMSPKQVQSILGHSNVSTTLNLYWSNIYEKTDLSWLPG